MCRGEGSQGRPWGSPSAEVCRLRPVDGLMQLPALSPLQDPTLHCARPSLQCPSSRDSGMLFRVKPAYPRVTADSAGTMTCLPDTILQLGKLRPGLSPATPPTPLHSTLQRKPRGEPGCSSLNSRTDPASPSPPQESSGVRAQSSTRNLCSPWAPRISIGSSPAGSLPRAGLDHSPRGLDPVADQGLRLRLRD